MSWLHEQGASLDGGAQEDRPVVHALRAGHKGAGIRAVAIVDDLGVDNSTRANTRKLRLDLIPALFAQIVECVLNLHSEA